MKCDVVFSSLCVGSDLAWLTTVLGYCQSCQYTHIPRYVVVVVSVQCNVSYGLAIGW